MKSYLIVILICAFHSIGINTLNAQENGESLKEEKQLEDEEFIQEVEDSKQPYKVLHAEPLYVDLIRDLGARKGEKEWNVGFGLFDKTDYEEYELLVEYEFAPVNRLGFEIELPFAFFSSDVPVDGTPKNTLEGLQLATQYTFLVSKKAHTSLAIGYLHKFKFISFDSFGDENIHEGNVFNPFFVAAKRWGRSLHTLIYTGPEFERLFNSGKTETVMAINANFHYMVPGTTNFIGLEMNMEVEDNDFEMTMRPQIRVEISDNILMGLVAGVPIDRQNERLSMFCRLIYEP